MPQQSSPSTPSASRTSPLDPAWRPLDGWLAVAVGVFAAGLFLRCVGFEFIELDDPTYVTARVEIQQGLSAATLRFIATQYVGANWHPVTMLSHWLDCTLFGLNPAGHHFTNVTLHGVCAALCFLLVQSICGLRGASLCAAAIFAVHPVHVESVAWVAERKDVLSGAFGLAALLAYLSWARHGGWQRFVAACALLALGLMAKPMLVTWPCVMLLLDHWPLARLWDDATHRGPLRTFAARVLEKAPLFALSAISSLTTLRAQGGSGAVDNYVEFWPRVTNAVQSYWAYVTQVFWPKQLYIPYLLTSRDTSWAAAALPAAALILVSLAAWFFRRRAPAVWIGWLWFLGTLVPTIGLVQVGFQSMADRYLYLPLCGLLIAVACPVAAWSQGARWRCALAAALAAAAVAGLAAKTWLQLPHWRDSTALFEHTLACEPTNHVALYVLGNVRLKKLELDAAEECFERSLRCKITGEALAGLGEVQLRRMHLERAVYYLQVAITVLPPEPRSNSLMYLADAVSLLGARDAAIAWYQMALALQPNLAQRHPEFAHQVVQADRSTDLLKRLREAEQRDTDDAIVAGRLAWIYSTSENPATRDPTKAVGLARKACDASERQDPHLLDVLAAALADAGQFSEAQRTAGQAIARAKELAQAEPAWTETAQEIDQRRQLYAQRKAYREPAAQGRRLFSPLFPPPERYEANPAAESAATNASPP